MIDDPPMAGAWRPERGIRLGTPSAPEGPAQIPEAEFRVGQRGQRGGPREYIWRRNRRKGGPGRYRPDEAREENGRRGDRRDLTCEETGGMARDGAKCLD